MAALFRLYSAYDIPASGDETISLIQASGKAHTPDNLIRQQGNAVIPAHQLMWFLEYSPDHGLADVAEAMENAGMHPPLYYFFLHYVMKYFGHETLMLRCISVLFSLGSVLAIYLIGNELKDNTLGLMAALLFAISTYGIKFSFMIRPYPMVMLLALLSAWVAITWAQKDSFEFRHWQYWTILAVSIAGFYSIYHFVFPLVFLWSFLLLNALRRPKDMLVILSIPAATAAAFSLWVPSLLRQLQVVNKGTYYFNELTNPIAGIGRQLTLNFTKYLPFKIVPSLFILAFLLILGLAGLWSVLRSRNGKLLVVSLILYILANTGLDLVMKTNTICVSKLAFFLNPVSLIFLAAGCLSLKDRFHWKAPLYAILVALAGVHSFFALPNDLSIDGPYGKTLIKELGRSMVPARKKLVVINQPQRRYVLPLIHAMESPPDFVFAGDMSYPEKLASLTNLKEFDFVMIIYFSEDPADDKILPLRQAGDYLEAQGYRVKTQHPCVMGHMIVLEKDVQNEPGPSVQADNAGRRPGSRNRICSFAQN
jgi:uncharacterized membrane protein